MVKTNLRGQNVIAGNAVSLNYDRIEHYKSFVDQNSAVGPNYTPSQLLDTFLEYRRNWMISLKNGLFVMQVIDLINVDFGLCL